MNSRIRAFGTLRRQASKRRRENINTPNTGHSRSDSHTYTQTHSSINEDIQTSSELLTQMYTDSKKHHTLTASSVVTSTF